MPVTGSDFTKSQGKELPLLITSDDCKDKTYIVTGGYSGIGYEAAKHLVELGAARVVLAVRDVKRGDEAVKTLEKATGRSGVVQVYALDLSSFESVKAFAAKATTDFDRIDGLIASAAIGFTAWRETNGYETQLLVNLISNVLLLALIMPHLQQIGKKHGIIPRVVFLGTIATFLNPPFELEQLNADDIIGDLNDRAKWKPFVTQRYPQTKLLLHLAIRHLAAVLPASDAGVIVNMADPGLCKTTWSKNMSFSVRAIAWWMNLFVGRTAEMGSRSALAGLKLEDSHGKFISDAEIAEYKIWDWMNQEEGKIWQERTWASLTRELKKIHPGCLDWFPVSKGV